MAASACGFVLLLLSVSVVQGDDGWSVTYAATEICATEGSTVELSCRYTYPSWFNSWGVSIQARFWFTRKDEEGPVALRLGSKYKHSCSGRSCILTITNVKKDDSAVYRFRLTSNHPDGSFTGEPGVTLSVIDDPNLHIVKYSAWELECKSKCRHPTNQRFVWYKNGKKIFGETSYLRLDSYDSVSSFSCAVQGHEGFPSDSTCASGSSCNRVSYTDRSICAFKGSSVDISCTYTSYRPVTSKQWFRSDRSGQWQSPSQPEDLGTGRVQVLDQAGDSTLRITELTEKDSGQYGFTFTAGSVVWGRGWAGTSLTVTDPDVQVQVIRSPAGLQLLCHSSCLPPRRSFVWYEDDKEVWAVASHSYSRRLKPGASYSCSVQGHEQHRSPPVYAPKVPSVSVSPSGGIVENSSVTLTCSSDANPAAHYTWYRTDSHPGSIHAGPQLVLSSILASDSRWFSCRAENQLGRTASQLVFINVEYPPRSASVSVSPSGDIVEGSSVTLTCSSDANPAANYTWYKEGEEQPQTSGVIHFTSIKSWHRGSYSCRSENDYGQISSSSEIIDVQYPPKTISVSVSPSGDIVEGSSVTLTCSSDANPAANYTWYKEDEEQPKASGQSFTISDVRAEHSGKYWCVARNQRGNSSSSSHVTVPAGWMKSAAAGSLSAVVVLIVLVSAFLWLRKKSFCKTSPGRVEVRRTNTQTNAAPAAHRDPAGQQDDLCYASISFSKSQDDALYSNVRAAQANRRCSDEEDVEYTMVHVKGGSPSPELSCREAEDCSSGLYSTVNKPRRA